MKPVIDIDVCIGCGVCESVSSDVFQMGDDGKAHVIKESGFDKATVDDAISQCPVQCISMQE